MAKWRTIIDLQETITVARDIYRTLRNSGKKQEAKEARVKIKLMERKIEEILQSEFSAWPESVVELMSQLNEAQKEVKSSINDVKAIQDKLDKFVDIVKKIDDTVKVVGDKVL